MLPPLWEIMTFIHTQCRRRSCPSALAAAAHVCFSLRSLGLAWCMFHLRGLLIMFFACSVHGPSGCVQVSGPSSPSCLLGG